MARPLIHVGDSPADRRAAEALRRQLPHWAPCLRLWDQTLRMVAEDAGIGVAFQPGLLVDEANTALTVQTPRGLVIHLHPHRFAEALQSCSGRPSEIAAYLHGAAVHELAHADGLMGQGHSPAFARARRRLEQRTAHLLPVIDVLVQRTLGMRGERMTADGWRAARGRACRATSAVDEECG